MKSISECEKMKNNLRKSRPELLAPAGSFDALCAAIDGGADAVYMGGVAFNARINAKNFTAEEMKRAIELAHLYGVKVYIAANTLIYDREKESFLRAAESAYLAGADALILADLGCAGLVAERIPIELHASTQMSGHSVYAAKELSALGFSRMVCAREMSRENLRAFVENSDIEAEVFVHGALCVCHSGQCLFSSLVGQRSGNRGECAQPCRLPYKTAKGEAYPLSLKDLSLARHVPELCDMGIASFKIEGRMKSPEYVRDVTRIWRRLIDEHRGASDQEMRELADIFSRQGFTDGYFVNKIDRKMLGIRKEENKETGRNLQKFEGITKKIPVDMKLCMSEGESISLKIICAERGAEAEVSGDVPEIAHTRPLDKDSVRKNLVKLGATSFVARDVDIEINGNLIVPISSLNSLRREAVELLEERIRESFPYRSEKDLGELTGYKENVSLAKKTTAEFISADRIPKSAREFFDVIYLPIDKYDGSVSGISMPAVVFDSELEEVEAMLERAKALGAKHMLVQNIAQLSLAKKYGFEICAGMRMNACNSDTVRELCELCAKGVLLSPELTLAQLRDMPSGVSACVYGRIPLMITEKCVSKEISDCKRCEAGSVMLTDRRNVKFPVLRAYGHRSEIYNSVPIYMADRMKSLPEGIGMHFVFSVESASEAEDIIYRYKKGLALSDNSIIRRIK